MLTLHIALKIPRNQAGTQWRIIKERKVDSQKLERATNHPSQREHFVSAIQKCNTVCNSVKGFAGAGMNDHLIKCLLSSQSMRTRDHIPPILLKLRQQKQHPVILHIRGRHKGSPRQGGQERLARIDQPELVISLFTQRICLNKSRGKESREISGINLVLTHMCTCLQMLLSHIHTFPQVNKYTHPYIDYTKMYMQVKNDLKRHRFLLKINVPNFLFNYHYYYYFVYDVVWGVFPCLDMCVQRSKDKPCRVISSIYCYMDSRD